MNDIPERLDYDTELIPQPYMPPVIETPHTPLATQETWRNPNEIREHRENQTAAPAGAIATGREQFVMAHDQVGDDTGAEDHEQAPPAEPPGPPTPPPVSGTPEGPEEPEEPSGTAEALGIIAEQAPPQAEQSLRATLQASNLPPAEIETALQLQVEAQAARQLALKECISSLELDREAKITYAQELSAAVNKISPDGVDKQEQVLMLAEEAPSAAHAALYNRLADKWQTTMAETSPAEQQDALPHFTNMAKMAGAYIIDEENAQTVLAAADDIGDVLVKVTQETMRGDVSHELMQRTTHRLMYGAYSGTSTPEGVQNIARGHEMLKFADNYAHIAPGGMDAFRHAIEAYANGELTDVQMQGATRLAADLLSEAPQVEAFVAEHMEFTGSQELEHFTFDAYTKQPSAETFSKLMLARKCLITIDAHSFISNYHDAIAIDRTDAFPNLRQLVHGQHPQVHRVVSEMVAYQETGDPAKISGQTRELMGDKVFDRTRYERHTDERVREDAGPTERATVIDHLILLENHTAPEILPPSVQTDEVLQTQLRDLHQSKPGDKPAALQQTLSHVNEKLVAQIQRGVNDLDPDTVTAMVWLERESAQTLRQMPFEDQLNAYKKPWFKELLRFQALTNTVTPYDAQAFETFAETIAGSAPETAYSELARRATSNIRELQQTYEGYERETDILWTANLNAVMVQLLSWQPAITAVGARQRAELMMPPHIRRTGD